jgi:pyridoxine 5'-phosphate synthase PdxJ
MADQKLSQLTAAAALTGAELVYVVQGGNQRRTTTGAISATAPGTDLTFTAATRTLASSTGADVVLPVATTADAGLESAADKTKLDGVATGATVNSPDATLLARANHTGTQAAGTITGLATVATTGAYADLSGKPTLGTAAATASTDYAPAAQGVTNGNSHNHDGGDGAQIAYGSLSGLPTLPTGTNTGDQTLTNTSNATSHTVTLSGSGGSLQLVEGSHITLTTSGTGSAGVVTISAHGGGGGGGSGTVTSVGLVAPTGFSVSGSPVTTSGDITLAFASGYSLPTTASQGNWDTAFTERLYWDGGSTGLNAATGRTSLGLAGAAVLNVGTTAGTVAAGDDSRITGALAATTAAATYQPLDSDLTAIAALSTTTFGRSLLTSADAAATRTTIGIAAADAAPQPLGATAAIGSSTDYAREDHAHQRDADTIVLACSDETTALTTGTNRVRFRMPFAATLLAVRASVNTAPTGSTLVVDINEGGTSVLGTKLSIDATELSSTTAASAATITDSSLADDAEISIDIDQIGSTVAGAGLKVALSVRRS